MKSCYHRWMIIALCAQAVAIAAAEDTTYQSRKLYPQHKLQQSNDIYNSAVKVQAANDSESRGLQQQELCKKLIQAEKYDEALKIAHEIASTPSVNAERRAAHHFLIADIYNRKMQASPNAQLMQQNRQRAMQAAQEVVTQKYPAKWHATEMASSLLKDLQDPQHMQQVSDWVQKRQCGGCDSTKENFAQRQLAYMESAAKKTVGGISAVKRTGSSLLGVFGRRSDKAASMPSGDGQIKPSSAVQLAAARPAPTALSAPWGSASKVESRSVSNSTLNLPGAGTVTFSRASNTAAQKSLASGSSAGSPRAPIIIDGATVRRNTPIESAVKQTDFSAVGTAASQPAGGRYIAENAVEVAPGVKLAGSAASTYASGQAPSRGAVKN
ncbi:MAG: hypothetical protein ACR2IE_19510 [Candidatus Sumerlaeaceae bacterium]